MIDCEPAIWSSSKLVFAVQFTGKVCMLGEGQIMDNWALEIEEKGGHMTSFRAANQIAILSQGKSPNCRVPYR